MKVFEYKVRIAGSRDHEVDKKGTAAEIEVVRAIHGLDSVIAIRETKDHQLNDKGQKLNDIGEKRRLQEIYGGALMKIEEVRTVNGLFTGALPTKPEAIDGTEASDTDETESEVEPGDDLDDDVIDERVNKSALDIPQRDDLANDPGNAANLRVKKPNVVGPKQTKAVKQVVLESSERAKTKTVSDARDKDAAPKDDDI